jgi:hypothetical protein
MNAHWIVVIGISNTVIGYQINFKFNNVICTNYLLSFYYLDIKNKKACKFLLVLVIVHTWTKLHNVSSKW